MSTLKRGGKLKRIRAVPAALILALLLTMLAGTVWDEDLAVHVDPAGIENATFVIGTHLIYIGALTNPLYEIAIASGVESGQERVYYKSELADGVWFDITSASTLEDITTGGTPVGDSVIAQLFLTHHTRSDGITYDLRTNLPVNIFDLRSPYDLETMDELLPLKVQYDLTLEMQADSEYGKAKIALMAEFFQTEVTNGVTQESDEALAALQRYYDVLAGNDGGSAEIEAVQNVMDAVDAARRAEVMMMLDAALNRLAQTLQTVADTPGEADEEGNESGGAKGSGADPNLQAAVNDCIANVMESYFTYSGKMLDPGVTVMAQARYDAVLRLISDAGADNHASCDVDVAEIIALDNIQNATVQNKDLELSLLNGTLLNRATSLYLGGLAAGENAEYREAAAGNAAGALLNGIIKRAGNELSILRSELEFLIDARCLREDGILGLSWMEDRLTQANGYPGVVPQDSFYVMAGESIDAHIDFLTRLRRKLELALGGNDTDKLQAQKAALQKELLSALDNNDLAGAKELENRIADLDAQLAGMPAGESAAGALASDLGAQAKGIIADGGVGDGGDLDDLMTAIDTLEGLLSTNFPAVFPVLEDLYGTMVRKRDLEGNTDFDDAISAIEDILLNNQDAYAASQRTGLSADLAAAIANGFLSGESGAGALSDYEKSVVTLLAYKMYGEETGDDSLDGAMRALAQRQIELGNPLVFTAIQDGALRYLSARSIAHAKKMRYVWNRNLNEATLAKGGTYYYYTVYSTEVVTGRQKDDIQYMTLPARFLHSVHLPSDYTQETFGLYAVYIPGTNTGVAASQELEGYAAELFALLLRAS